MPCYHFTFHAYGTWMPDKKKGYVKRKKGVLPRDEGMASNYRANQKQPTVKFTNQQQQVIAATLHVAGEHLDATVHCIAIEPTHIHTIVSWTHARHWEAVRRAFATRSPNNSTIDSANAPGWSKVPHVSRSKTTITSVSS